MHDWSYHVLYSYAATRTLSWHNTMLLILKNLFPTFSVFTISLTEPSELYFNSRGLISLKPLLMKKNYVYQIDSRGFFFSYRILKILIENSKRLLESKLTSSALRWEILLLTGTNARLLASLCVKFPRSAVNMKKKIVLSF